jgi:hypothetical protein
MSGTLERWGELADAQAAGDALTAEELAFLQAHADDDALAEEHALFADIARLGQAQPVREDDRRGALATLARLDAQLAAHRRRRWMVASGAAVFAAAAAVLLWIALPRGATSVGEPTPEARVSQGSFVSADDGTTTGEAIPARRWVRAVDRACLELSSARACFDPDTELRLDGDAIELRRGQVHVEAGALAVVDAGGPRVIALGERWAVAAARDVLPGTLAEPPSATGAVVVTDDAPSEPVVAPAGDGPALTERTDGTARPAVRRRDEAPTKSAGQMLAEARALANTGSLGRAVAAYEALARAHATSAEAHAAQVSLGELQLRRGHTRDALRAFDRYLARGGGLAEEARWGRVRALHRLARYGERDRAIDDLLTRHPRTIYADDARALRGG